MKKWRLLTENRGAATVEFALMTLLFFMVIIVALDFGLYIAYRQRLAGAVEHASIIAFNSRATGLVAANGTLPNYINATADLPGTAVNTTVTCHEGGNQTCKEATDNTRQCACITMSGATPTYTAAACGNVCASGSTAGYYLTVRSTYTYKTFIVPQSVLNNNVMTEQVTMRLQ